MVGFSQSIIDWHTKYGRHNLPWQRNTTPYRVWISEIMLQQTQVATVIPFYKKFMASFPSIKKLALADIDDVLSHWSGLGYYARARNLHKAAHILHHKYKGRFPKKVEEVEALPGIGKSTAGAILSLAMEIPAVILDGNVKRVLTRHNMIPGWPGNKRVHDRLWDIAADYTPNSDVKTYNQAMMDLGATVCTRSSPKCQNCPVITTCKAYAHGEIASFPGKKPKAAMRRVKKVTMLIIQRQEDNAILLEKRPEKGIWGGLWSFPEATDNLLQKKNLLQSQLGTTFTKVTTLPTLEHSFSHFDLKINPILYQSKKSFVVNEKSHYDWHQTNTDAPGGLAAPIQKLLNQLKGAHDE